MNVLLAQVLQRYTKCIVSIEGRVISLEWIWPGSSLRWASRVPAGMPITLVGRNTILVGKYIPKNQIGKRLKKLWLRVSFGEYELVSRKTPITY